VQAYVAAGRRDLDIQYVHYTQYDEDADDEGDREPMPAAGWL
jgi:hypothetical protein